MDKKNKKEITYSLLLIILPVTALFTAYFLTKDEPVEVANEEKIDELVEEKAPAKINPFANYQSSATAVIVKDLNTGDILYAKNPDKSLPLASLTKVMTSLVTKIHSDTDNFSVAISLEALSTDGESFLYPGERFRLNDLINFTMVTSSNDGAAAIADAIQNIKNSDTFESKMNKVASELGMTNTYFLNETGLDQSEVQAGSFGSARDMATLFEYTLKRYPEIFEATRKANISTYSQTGFLHTADNTNKIVDNLPNVLGSKTGYTDIAGGNLGVIVDPALNRPVVIIVLGSTAEGRFEEVQAISNKLVEYFAFQS